VAWPNESVVALFRPLAINVLGVGLRVVSGVMADDRHGDPETRSDRRPNAIEAYLTGLSSTNELVTRVNFSADRSASTPSLMAAARRGRALSPSGSAIVVALVRPVPIAITAFEALAERFAVLVTVAVASVVAFVAPVWFYWGDANHYVRQQPQPAVLFCTRDRMPVDHALALGWCDEAGALPQGRPMVR